MSTPLISICIPVYNGEGYLKACLDSALAQDYSEFEIVIVDDRSTDGSYDIAESYSVKSDKIKLYRNENNRGLVGNWNKCLEAAKGVWIKFLFQDDLLHPSCIRKMAEAAGESNALVVSERSFRVEEQVPLEMKKYYEEEVLTLERIFSGHVPPFIAAAKVAELSVQYTSLNFIGEPTTILFRKELINTLGVFEKNIYQICDLEYWLRIGSRYGLITVPEPLTTFRVHTASATFNTISRKVYTAAYADPAILSGKMLYDPVFAELRKNLPFKERQRLREYHYLKQYEAQLYKKEHPEVETPQSSVLERFPAYKKIQNGRLLTRLIHQFMVKRRIKQNKG